MSEERLYYLQDKRDCVGNSMLWWAKDCKGYVCDIAKAHIFTQEEIDEGNYRSETDIPWPKDFIDSRIQWHIDTQDCNKNQLEQWSKSNDES